MCACVHVRVNVRAIEVIRYVAAKQCHSDSTHRVLSVLCANARSSSVVRRLFARLLPTQGKGREGRVGVCCCFVVGTFHGLLYVLEKHRNLKHNERG